MHHNIYAYIRLKFHSDVAQLENIVHTLVLLIKLFDPSWSEMVQDFLHSRELYPFGPTGIGPHGPGLMYACYK